MRVDFKKIVLAFVAVGFVACGSGANETKETRQTSDFSDWNEFDADLAVDEWLVPKSYILQKPEIKAPFIAIGDGLLSARGGDLVLIKIPKIQKSSILEAKVEGSNCRVLKFKDMPTPKTEEEALRILADKDFDGYMGFEEYDSIAVKGCEAKTIKTIEITTPDGIVTYKF